MTENQLLLREIEHEESLTLAFLDRLHEVDLDWTPSADSWNIGQLAAHLAVIPHWGLAILHLDIHDMASASGWTPPEGITAERIKSEFEDNTARLSKATATIDMSSVWSFVNGGEVLASLPRSSAIRHYVLGHIAHHRGQLALYLRLVGAGVPGSYGSSRNETPRATT